MNDQQNWKTEEYKGMDVHVTALPHGDSKNMWDFTVRVADPGADSSAEGALVADSGDNGDYPTEKAAVEAGFAQGYAMVDKLQG